MRPHWPIDTPCTRLVLEVEAEVCTVCGQPLQVCDHRRHRIYTLHGPVELVCKLVHCRDRVCPGHAQTISPYTEATLTLPWWLIGWDVFCWMGQRRFARHWSVPQIRAELRDSYQIPLSADAIEDSLRRYQTMLAARQQDAQVLAEAYQNATGLVLSIDGLQPEKGHETLYVVRELTSKRVWFAEALLSSSAAEVRRLIAKARTWAEQLGLPVQLWLSDKQEAFVTGIAAEFPGVPHRYCANHFLRDLAKPMLEADSRAKVRMRSKVRGLRAIEREVLQHQHRAGVDAAEAAAVAATIPTAADVAGSVVVATTVPEAGATVVPVVVEVPVPVATPARVVVETPAPGEMTATAPPATAPAVAALVQAPAEEAAAAGSLASVVLDYCTAVRGILNDDQGGALEPPGLRMAEALGEVRASLQRCLDRNRSGAAHAQLERLAGCIDRGLAEVQAEQAEVREQVQEVQRVASTLDASQGPVEERQAQFTRLQEEFATKATPFYVHLATVMASFLPGLFAGGEALAWLQDNLDLERFFRTPKGHERRIHGHRHAGVRIVQEGPTLLLALDAHLAHPDPFTVDDLRPYQNAQPPACQEAAINRRKVMRKARSKKNGESCCKTWNTDT